MNLIEKVRSNPSANPRFEPLGGLLEKTRQQGCDFFDRDPAGKFPGHGASHAVADCERKVRFSWSMLPRFFPSR